MVLFFYLCLFMGGAVFGVKAADWQEGLDALLAQQPPESTFGASSASGSEEDLPEGGRGAVGSRARKMHVMPNFWAGSDSTTGSPLPGFWAGSDSTTGSPLPGSSPAFERRTISSTLASAVDQHLPMAGSNDSETLREAELLLQDNETQLSSFSMAMPRAGGGRHSGVPALPVLDNEALGVSNPLLSLSQKLSHQQEVHSPQERTQIVALAATAFSSRSPESMRELHYNETRRDLEVQRGRRTVVRTVLEKDILLPSGGARNWTERFVQRGDHDNSEVFQSSTPAALSNAYSVKKEEDVDHFLRAESSAYHDALRQVTRDNDAESLVSLLRAERKRRMVLTAADRATYSLRSEAMMPSASTRSAEAAIEVEVEDADGWDFYRRPLLLDAQKRPGVLHTVVDVEDEQRFNPRKGDDDTKIKQRGEAALACLKRLVYSKSREDEKTFFKAVDRFCEEQTFDFALNDKELKTFKRGLHWQFLAHGSDGDAYSYINHYMKEHAAMMQDILLMVREVTETNEVHAALANLVEDGCILDFKEAKFQKFMTSLSEVVEAESQSVNPGLRQALTTVSRDFANSCLQRKATNKTQKDAQAAIAMSNIVGGVLQTGAPGAQAIFNKATGAIIQKTDPDSKARSFWKWVQCAGGYVTDADNIALATSTAMGIAGGVMEINALQSNEKSLSESMQGMSDYLQEKKEEKEQRLEVLEKVVDGTPVESLRRAAAWDLIHDDVEAARKLYRDVVAYKSGWPLLLWASLEVDINTGTRYLLFPREFTESQQKKAVRYLANGLNPDEIIDGSKMRNLVPRLKDILVSAKKDHKHEHELREWAFTLAFSSSGLPKHYRPVSW